MQVTTAVHKHYFHPLQPPSNLPFLIATDLKRIHTPPLLIVKNEGEQTTKQNKKKKAQPVVESDFVTTESRCFIQFVLYAHDNLRISSPGIALEEMVISNNK